MKLAIRADATPAMGTGHVMRCLALAQAWRALGGEVVFLCAALIDRVEARIGAEGFAIEWVPEGLEVPAGALDGVAWAVLDGYHLDIGQQKSLRVGGARLLVIDDYAALPRYEADLLLNQNLFATAALYEGRLAEDVPCLIGAEFALLRQELAAAIVSGRPHSGAFEHVLLVLGGADVANQTRRLAAVLAGEAVPGKRITVVVGPGSRGLEAVDAAAGPKELRLLHDPSDLPALFVGADLAISCAGVTMLELAALGTPVLALAATPHEQRAAKAADALGFAHDLGDVAGLTAAVLTGELRRLEAAPDELLRMVRAGQATVDGQGAERVVEAMLGLN